jgi:hypothetical protein
MANPAPSPAAGDDFPDAPDDRPGPVQDQPDLDAFAERLGMSTVEEGADGEPTDVRRRSTELAEKAAAMFASGLSTVSDRLASLADRIRPEAPGPDGPSAPDAH